MGVDPFVLQGPSGPNTYFFSGIRSNDLSDS